MPASYGQDHRIFTLSIFANLVTGVQGGERYLEKRFKQRLESALENFKPELGTWEIVWGPVVYQSTFSQLADNAMYVVRRRSPKRTEYCIAIAAVNSKSLYDWFVEDLNIITQVPWWETNHRTETRPKIAKGIDIAFTHLIKMRSGTTLEEFLTEEIGRNSQITVAGHSFGGAVAPAIALWLQEQQGVWNPKRDCEIRCLMSGAPSPGNADFARFYQKSGLSERTTTIENHLDLATHLWNANEIPKVPRLYVPEIPPTPPIQAVMTKFRLKSILAGGYSRLKASNREILRGVFREKESPRSDNDVLRFLKQAQYQHIVAYFQELGLTKLQKVYASNQGGGFDLVPGAQESERTAKALRRLG